MADSDLMHTLRNLNVHDHLCLVYETQQEQFAAAIPFIALGLERGEKCLYIADDNTAEQVMRAIRKDGIDIEKHRNSGALVIANKKDSYLKKGYFDPDWMLRFLEETLCDAKSAGFSALRITGEMTWALSDADGVDRLIEYENKLNSFLPRHDCLAICQYNRNRFPPEVIRDIIYTHPLVIYGGYVCHNFYYIPPEDFLAPDNTARLVDRLLFNLKNRQEVLSASERSYHNLFHNAPIALYEADYSAVMEETGQNKSGVDAGNDDSSLMPENSAAYARRIRISNINSAACQLFGVEGADDFQTFLTDAISRDVEMRKTFIETLNVLKNRSAQTGKESLIPVKSGARRHIVQRWIPVPHAERNYSSILFAVIDATEIRELQARQAAQDEHERREFEAHKSFLSPPLTAVTAHTYGNHGIREQYPDMFDSWVEKYGKLLEEAAERGIYKTHSSVSPELKSLVDELGFLRAGPRDIIDIHSISLKSMDAGTARKKRAYMTEGRILLLELMGYLLSHYRTLAMGKKG